MQADYWKMKEAGVIGKPEIRFYKSR